MSTATLIHPVDERLPGARLIVLGLQHVLVMYAGAVAVPLIVGRALQLPAGQVALLISADLFCCGIVTLVQSWGLTRWFGVRLPVMMGVTFAAVGPLVAMANAHPGSEGARTMFGAILVAGLVSMMLAPAIGRIRRYFPRVVTGTIIAVIGISLMRVGIGWAMGGVPPNHPDYAAPGNLSTAVAVLAAILLIAKYGRGFVANIAVLLGLAAGVALSAAFGGMSFTRVGQAAWFGVVTPFAFGMPIFDALSIFTMVLVMLVVLIESTGMFLALSEIVERPLSAEQLVAGLRTDGLGTMIGGLFNTFPYTSFSQNVGLVSVTGVRSRFVCVAAGFILMGLGLLPKMAALVESIPPCVLGGAGLVMFGMVTTTGIRILASVNFEARRHNLYIVAVSIGVGMIPLVAPRWAEQLPRRLHPLLDSGILLATLTAVALNVFFGGSAEEDSISANRSRESSA
jgi:xanthine permease